MCRIDTAFCSGKVSDPKPNNKFGGLEFKNPAATPHATMNIKSWIEGIGKSSGSTDMLSTFDKSIDGSIGGLGSKMESMLGAKRQVPLFEFRGLDTAQTKQFESWTNKVDSAIQDIHKKHKDAP